MSEIQRIKHIDYTQYLHYVRDRFLEEAGISVSNQARELAPVDTGRLRASINWDIRGETCAVGTNVEYAEYMEYGTVRNPSGQPFLRPAARMMQKPLRARLIQLLKEAAKNAK